MYELIKSRTGMMCVFKDADSYPIATVDNVGKNMYTVSSLNSRKKKSKLIIDIENVDALANNAEFLLFVKSL